MHDIVRRSAIVLATLLSTATTRAATSPHNVLLFVASGLRPGMVTPQTAPALAELLKQGVRFAEGHAVFPTLSAPNAAALAGQHMPGDTGAFGDIIRTGASDTDLHPFLAQTPTRGAAAPPAGDTALLSAAAAANISTAAIGPHDIALLFDHSEPPDRHTILIDGTERETTQFPPEMQAALKKAGPRPIGAKLLQWRTDIAAKAVLPLFRDRQRPFVLVFWCNEPDAAQRSQTESSNRLLPGIGGPASLAAIHATDDALAELLSALKALGLDASTDVIVTADHGASVISKESATSYAAAHPYKDVPLGQLPPGFVAIDLAHGLETKLFDPDGKPDVALAAAAHPAKGNGLVGADPADPQVIVAANGGIDLIYLPQPDPALAARLVNILAPQDYVSGLFLDPRLGSIPGTLPLSAVGLDGAASSAAPSIVVNFRSFTLGCADPTTCGVEVADTPDTQGQGISGSFSRGDTAIMMAAVGPDFKAAYQDPWPVGNADIGRTISAILGLSIPAKGSLAGRILTEAMPNGAMVGARPLTMRSMPDEVGRTTVVRYQIVGPFRYYDAGGYPNRTLGLE